MDNLIRRQDAIDAVVSSAAEWDRMYIQDLNCRIRDAIKQLPSAEPQWISCNERLPEKCGLYLVSGGDKVWICELAQMITVFGWVNGATNPVVAAWMPLPEPYKGENDE